MKKTAELIGNSEFRRALVRLCRMALEPVGDGRKRLADWENSHREPSDEAMKAAKDALCAKVVTVTEEELGRDPLLWLRALDAHCIVQYPNNVYAFAVALDDGDGQEAWLLRRAPAAGKGAYARQFGNLQMWLVHHRYVPRRSAGGVPCQVDCARGHHDWIATNLASTPIIVGIVNFDDGARLRITEHAGSESFSCPSLQSPNERLERALQLIESAKTAGAHILVFPELSLPREMRIAIQERLCDASESGEESHVLSVPIIVLGSFHECDSGQWRNRSQMVCGLDGAELLVCDKRSGVTAPLLVNGPALRERIDAAPTPLSALHLDTIGLVGVAICKDLFDEPIASAIPVIEPDWLLVPSMSNDLGPHAVAAKTLHDRLGTVVAIANQEMPGHEPVRGFVWHETRHDSEAPLKTHEVALANRPKIRRIK